MNLDALPGNQRLKAQLVHTDRLPHAILLGGPKGSGRHILARLLAQAMVCNRPDIAPCGVCPNCKRVAEGIHPDVPPLSNFVSSKDRDKKDIVVDTIRNLRADAFIRPNQAKRKVYLIDPAETMNVNAQNALLKVLEDGPEYASFLLLAENPMALLDTIRSRCVYYELTPPAGELPPTQAEDPKVTAALTRFTDSLRAKSELSLMEWSVEVQSSKLTRDQMAQFYERLLARCADALAGRPGGADLASALSRQEISALTDLTKTGSAAMERNVSPAHSAGWFGVSVWEIAEGSL